MKKSLFLLCLVFIGCSKKSDNTPKDSPGTVSISGSSYNTVVVGTQTWTAANYNGPGGQSYNNAANSTTYGKLYTLAEAKAIALPSGWRLATKADFDNLLIAIGANALGNGGFSFPVGCSLKLMTTADWTNQNGTNDLKFNAEPAGFYSGGEFAGQGIEAMFLSATIDLNAPVILFVTPNFITTSSIYLPNVTDRGSVRFVKDN